MALRVETVTDLAGLETLRPAWEALTAAGAGDVLFGSHVWNATWWRHYAELGDLRVTLARDGDRVVGIWPLYRQHRTFRQIEQDMIGDRRMALSGKHASLHSLCYLGCGEICSDYLSPLLEPGREAEVFDALVAGAAAQRDWDLLDLPDMADDNPLLPAIRDVFARRLGPMRERFRYHAPIAPLVGTYEDYLATLSKKSRFNARKKLRQLMLNHDVAHHFHDDPATLEEAMSILIELHQARWNADGLPGVFIQPRFAAFHRDIAARALERGWLRLGILRVNGKPVFATYGFHLGDRVYLYQQGSDPDPHWDNYNLGYVALGFAITDAVERGAKVYDFLRGEAEYKLHWARERRRLVQLQAARPGLRGRLFMLHSTINTDDRLRARVKRILGKS